MISAQLSSTLIFVLWTSTGRARLHLNINSFDSSSHRCMTMWGMRPLRHHTVDVVPILQEQNMMWRIVNFGHHVKLWVPAKPWSYSQLDLLVIVYFLPWASLYTWKHHPSRVFFGTCWISCLHGIFEPSTGQKQGGEDGTVAMGSSSLGWSFDQVRCKGVPASRSVDESSWFLVCMLNLFNCVSGGNQNTFPGMWRRVNKLNIHSNRIRKGSLQKVLRMTFRMRRRIEWNSWESTTRQPHLINPVCVNDPWFVFGLWSVMD